jgi:hypothetical protein
VSLYLVTVALVFAILAAGIAVDRAYRRFASRHPQLGPFRDAGHACGSCAEHAACDARKACAAGPATGAEGRAAALVQRTNPR